VSGLVWTDADGNVRTNGRGVPRGWNRCSPQGSVYFWHRDENLALLRRGSKWVVLDTVTKATLATGATMVEAASKAKGENR